ncbi:hypothetical protein HHUSO_G6785 [Huso huso]|uniref:Uncharacterized protein n=1 Tax=Huso huso TaxID=61971 RepID=A0ABR0ZYF2_HUSHU
MAAIAVQTIHQGGSRTTGTPWTQGDWKRWQAAHPGICMVQSWLSLGQKPEGRRREGELDQPGQAATQGKGAIEECSISNETSQPGRGL